jgi:hypothetical protein
VFYGATEITKADFFFIFNKFLSKTFTADLYKAVDRSFTNKSSVLSSEAVSVTTTVIPHHTF